MCKIKESKWVTFKKIWNFKLPMTTGRLAHPSITSISFYFTCPLMSWELLLPMNVRLMWLLAYCIIINSSETSGLILTKFCKNCPLVHTWSPVRIIEIAEQIVPKLL